MPSTLLDAQQITRQHGARTVLEVVDVRVDASSRIALVGPNGAGESTLLRILAGSEAPTPAPSATLARSATCHSLPTRRPPLDRGERSH